MGFDQRAFEELHEEPTPEPQLNKYAMTTTAENAPLLETNGLTKSFRGLVALKNHSLRVNPQEIVGVIGPNGSGKSTLFNLITGFIRPSSGAVRLLGRAVDTLEPPEIARLGVARTFQGTRLFKTLSVLENVRAGAQLAYPTTLFEGLLGANTAKTRAVDAASHELLDLVGLSSQSDVRAGSLPYGDQRRLEIARALATRPKILMMDEPAAGLDSRETRALLDLIQRIRQEFHVAVIVIEHDMELIMNLCERIQVLAYGETICEGSPREVQSDARVREAYLGGEIDA